MMGGFLTGLVGDVIAGRLRPLGLGFGALLVIGALGCAGLLLHQRWYGEGWAARDAAARAEQAAQAAANQAAIADADKALFAAADALSLKQVELSDALKQLAEAAAHDPAGAKPGLSRSLVRHLNALR